MNISFSVSQSPDSPNPYAAASLFSCTLHFQQQKIERLSYLLHLMREVPQDSKFAIAHCIVMRLNIRNIYTTKASYVSVLYYISIIIKCNTFPKYFCQVRRSKRWLVWNTEKVMVWKLTYIFVHVQDMVDSFLVLNSGYFDGRSTSRIFLRECLVKIGITI